MSRVSPAYERIRGLIEAERCVVLDGAVGTELERVRPRELGASDEGLFGTWALYQAPHAVLDLHRRYAEVGCDVVSTDTWAILSAPELELQPKLTRTDLTHWMDVARLGIRLARQAIADAGREGECAVAFAISEDVDSPRRQGTVELLTRVWEDEPPDLVLMETLSLIREDLTLRTVETLLSTGIPVWLSFRRCRHGVCGVYGQHWGPPEGDLFGRAARRFEEMGVGALLINCLPVDHVPGMLPWLRDFTDLPLGVYPNLGYLSPGGWRFDERIGPKEYAELALQWRAEGAQIAGGCGGTGPTHLAAARAALAGTRPGRPKPPPLSLPEAAPLSVRALEPWRDERGRRVFPLPFPELVVDPGVFVPTQGSFLVWRHLLRHGVGAGRRCLDVGCGCGILAVQLALNGAREVTAIDIDRAAVANTLANAFRNGVSDHVRGERVDVYAWDPGERFEVIVASLYQMPVDPYEQVGGHRPLDFWGRNLLDHFLAMLPRVLAPDGIAYVMQLSVIGQRATAELLDAVGLQARVIDFGFFPFSELFERNREQIARVEQLSDAYHLTVKDEDVVVAYLLEVTHRAGGAGSGVDGAGATSA